ncbi:MAG: ATP synthase F0 subunit B [Oscillospiraceae bacterium]|nr:ATP synthase F0 subunit B [Oscillospiraceae bacterium]
MLTINPSELIWTIIGFLTLYFLLKKFLFEPIIRVMDARKARISEGMSEERQARDALDEDARQLETLRIEQLEAAKGQVQEEQQREEERRAQALQDAREAAKRLCEEGKERAKALCDQTEDQLRAQGEALSAMIVARLLDAGNTEQ